MSRVSADCECGYRVSSSSNQIASLLFTEAVQKDFRKLSSLNDSKDWEIKQLMLDAVPDMDRLGRIVEDKNIILNATGLQLIVRSTLVEGDLVSTCQIQSTREDIQSTFPFTARRVLETTTPLAIQQAPSIANLALTQQRASMSTGTTGRRRLSTFTLTANGLELSMTSSPRPQAMSS
jgi:hypothetical protein